MFAGSHKVFAAGLVFSKVTGTNGILSWANCQYLNSIGRVVSIVLETRILTTICNSIDFGNSLRRHQNLSRNGSSMRLMNYVFIAAWTPRNTSAAVA